MAETMLDLIAKYKASGRADERLGRRLGEALRVTGPVLVVHSIWSYSPEYGGSVRSSSELAIQRYAEFVDSEGYVAHDMERIPPEAELSIVLGVPLASRMAAPPPGAPPRAPLGRSLRLLATLVDDSGGPWRGGIEWHVDESDPACGDWRALLLALDHTVPIGHNRIMGLVARAIEMGVSVTFAPAPGPIDGERTVGGVIVSVDRDPRPGSPETRPPGAVSADRD